MSSCEIISVDILSSVQDNPPKSSLKDNSTSCTSSAYPTFTDNELRNIKCPDLSIKDVELLRKNIRDYFHQTFTIYERLFHETLVSDESYFMRGTPLRHPLIFYYAHTACFFINKLMVGGYINRRINPHIEFTCAIGVDEMSWDDLNPAHYVWPTREEITHYREQVRQFVDTFILETDFCSPISWDSPMWVIMMGIEHERIHLETSSVLFRQLPISAVQQPSSLFNVCRDHHTPSEVVSANNKLHEIRNEALREANKSLINGVDITVTTSLNLSPVPTNVSHSPVPAKWVIPSSLDSITPSPLSLKHVAARCVVMGKDLNHHEYGWDNEYGHLETSVSAFNASTTLVSNRQYLQFMRDGGYFLDKFWTPEGKQFMKFRSTDQDQPYPEFWVPVFENGNLVNFLLRHMGEEVEMQWDNPVEVNNLESKAYANYLSEITNKKLRLPSENEWYALYDHCNEYYNQEQEDHHTMLDSTNANLAAYCSTTPVTTHQFHGSGFFDVVGNVWQNCETAMMPLPGFKVHPVYDDFTVPTFDNVHSMIKGGSFISTGNESSYHSRYAFRRHFYQHAGIRIVESDLILGDLYSSKHTIIDDKTIANSIMDEYKDLLCTEGSGVGQSVDVIKMTDAFANIIEKHLENKTQNLKDISILYVGCGVGRGVFELAKKDYVSSVVGYDMTTRIILPAVEIQNNHSVSFAIPDEGDLQTYHKLHVTTDAASTSSCPNMSAKHQAILDIVHKVEFVQGDVCNLAADKFQTYDVIIAHNIEEKFFPKKALSDLALHLNPEGIIITSICGMPSGDMHDWLGGYRNKQTGEIVTIFEGLKNCLNEKSCKPIDINSKDKFVCLSHRINHRVKKVIDWELFAFQKI